MKIILTIALMVAGLAAGAQGFIFDGNKIIRDTLPTPELLPNDTVKCILKRIVYHESSGTYSRPGYPDSVLYKKENVDQVLSIVQAVYERKKVWYWKSYAPPVNDQGFAIDIYVSPTKESKVVTTLKEVIGWRLPEYYELIPISKLHTNFNDSGFHGVVMDIVHD